jgi:hypothetical protein
MRIEDITPETLKDESKVSGQELYYLRHRFIQIFRNNFEGNDKTESDDFDRSDFMAKYRLLKTEFRRREYRSSVTTAIDVALFKSVWKGVKVSNFGDVPVVKNYLSIGGQFIDTPKAAEAIEIIIQDSEEGRCEDLEKTIAALIQKETGRPAAFTYDPEGPEGEHIPVFDLILQSRKKTETAKAEKKTIDIQKPEITDTQIRIPVGSSCDVTATITIDATKGIQALYCGEEKRIRTYLFDKEKWTMATARAWIKEHKTKAGEDRTRLVTEKATTRHESILRNHSEFEKKPWITAFREAQGKKYTVLMGYLKGQKTLTEMEYLYPANTWTEAEARNHGKNHNAKRFAPAGKQDPHYHTSPLRKSLTSTQRKECDAETIQIRENEKKAKFPHEFKAAQYTHPNGHPRCLACGDEQPIGNVCGMPPKWYEKHEWDDEEAWKKEREKIDFSKARANAYFKFIKIDEKQHIVGGVIYAPSEIDSQDQYTDSVEIQKAMYKFMEGYAKNTSRIKIMHKGRSYDFPILESFQPEQDITKGSDTIKAGAWWIMIKVKNKAIWSQIESGELTGFSMGGRARA